jgi:hypothetical protein
VSTNVVNLLLNSKYLLLSGDELIQLICKVDKNEDEAYNSGKLKSVVTEAEEIKRTLFYINNPASDEQGFFVKSSINKILSKLLSQTSNNKSFLFLISEG